MIGKLAKFGLCVGYIVGYSQIPELKKGFLFTIIICFNYDNWGHILTINLRVDDTRVGHRVGNEDDVRSTIVIQILKRQGKSGIQVGAFYYIFRAIIGRSSVAANLRAMVWTSIFTHDMRRYRRSFYKRMGDFTTLIIGPTGSGKELVARAVGLSRYIRFDDTRVGHRVGDEDYVRSTIVI